MSAAIANGLYSQRGHGTAGINCSPSHLCFDTRSWTATQDCGISWCEPGCGFPGTKPCAVMALFMSLRYVIEHYPGSIKVALRAPVCPSTAAAHRHVDRQIWPIRVPDPIRQLPQAPRGHVEPSGPAVGMPLASKEYDRGTLGSNISDFSTEEVLPAASTIMSRSS